MVETKREVIRVLVSKSEKKAILALANAEKLSAPGYLRKAVGLEPLVVGGARAGSGRPKEDK
jgi:hypothetical protein